MTQFHINSTSCVATTFGLRELVKSELAPLALDRFAIAATAAALVIRVFAVRRRRLHIWRQLDFWPFENQVKTETPIEIEPELIFKSSQSTKRDFAR